MCHHCYESGLEGHTHHVKCCHCGMVCGPAQEMPYHESPLKRIHQLENELGERSKTIEQLGIQLADLAMKARVVMGDLEKHGPSIVPHLLDTDDNDGQYLRTAVERVLGKS